MRTMSQIVAAISIMMAASTVYADKLGCNSENLRISGQISTKYFRMGHSVSNSQINSSRSFVVKPRVDPESGQNCHPRHPWEC